jgi:hypothetical protein
MPKHLKLISAVGGLAILMLSAGVLISLSIGLDAFPGRYPASVIDPSEGFDYAALGQGAVRWQSVYATRHDLSTVKTWYLQRLGISPASDQNLASVNDCNWLNQVKSNLLMTHSVTVLACSGARGTRIVVNHGVRLGP